MEHNKISIKEIVGRVIRNTRVQDTSYFADILTWVTEACSLMRTKWTLQKLYQDIEVKDHRANMPCGLVILQSVEYDGQRLPARELSRHPSSITPEQTESGIYISTVKAVETPTGDLTYLPDGQVITLPTSSTHWYYEDGPGALGFSFKEGIVRVHYKATPTDPHGWPLIPDQENYKEAIYWYCRAKMIETGWTDPVMNWTICDAKWQDQSEKAIAAIVYPSTNRMEQLTDMVRLIPPQDYFESFFNPYA